MTTGFERPEGLSDLGNAAYEKIMKILEENGAFRSGGCRVFYSPEEWMERGEQYGTDAELVVVYDGGDHARFFSMDADSFTMYASTERMREALEEVGAWFEECTGWYAAVYSM
jgi:hypothetical protein